LFRIKNYWECDGIDADRTMLWAAFMVSFSGFLRSGEICIGIDGLFDPERDLSA